MSYEIQYQGSKASLTSLSWQRVKPTRHLLLVHIGTSCFSGNNRQSLLEKIRLFRFLLGICIDLVMFVVPSSALQIQQNVCDGCIHSHAENVICSIYEQAVRKSPGNITVNRNPKDKRISMEDGKKARWLETETRLIRRKEHNISAPLPFTLQT